MSETNKETETKDDKKTPKELRNRQIYIKQRLSEIKYERAALQEELERIKASKG